MSRTLIAGQGVTTVTLHRRGLRLHARDLALLQVLEEGRFLTSAQAARYIWHHRDGCNRRLKQLEVRGYISRVADPYARLTIIRPTKEGIRELLRRGIVRPEEVSWDWKQGQRTIHHLAHETHVNELRFLWATAARQAPGVQLLTCRSGPRLWDTVTGSGGKRYHVRPDRYVVFRVPGSDQPQHFFVEVDRGTRPLKSNTADRRDVSLQLFGYSVYAHEGRFAAVYAPAVSFRALVVIQTPTEQAPEQRRNNLLSVMLQTMAAHGLKPGSMRGYATWDDLATAPLGPVFLTEADTAPFLQWLAAMALDAPLHHYLDDFPELAELVDPAVLRRPYRRRRPRAKHPEQNPILDLDVRDAVLGAALASGRLRRYSVLEPSWGMRPPS